MSEYKWFVFWTLGGRENKVLRKVENFVKEKGWMEGDEPLIERIFLPKQMKKDYKTGKTKEKPLYGGYIFIKMKPDKNAIIELAKATGLRPVAGYRGGLVTVDEEEMMRIEKIVEKMREEVEEEIPFKVGDSVKIVGGPFEGQQGKIISINSEKKKLIVESKMFNREMRLEVSLEHVQKV